MVVLLTPSGLQSHEVRSDIDYALGNKNYSGRVISVLAGSQDEASEDAVPWILRRFQMIRLPEAPIQIEESLKRIAEDLTDFSPPLALVR